MTSIRAVVRDRRIELAAPEEIPDGTEVLVELTPVSVDDDRPPTPEEIAAMLAAMEKVEPFDMTDQERAEAEAWGKKVNDYTIANMDKGIGDLFR